MSAALKSLFLETPVAAGPADALTGFGDVLALAERTGSLIKAAEARAARAEARAEEIAMVAIAQVKAVSAQLQAAEQRLKDLEDQSSATIRGLRQQVAAFDDWAVNASRQLQEANARTERAEARAAEAEAWLARIRASLEQNLSVCAAPPETAAAA